MNRLHQKQLPIINPDIHMNLKNISLIILVALATACSEPRSFTLAPETLYTGEGLSVITSFFNSRRQTTTLLYGNAAAQRAVARGNAGLAAGEDYRLVTWEQHANPLWFGGNINGHIKSIERVTTTATPEGAIVNHYELLEGNLANAPTDSLQQKRIRYIYSLRPLVFP
jgi:hypothetical protein